MSSCKLSSLSVVSECGDILSVSNEQSVCQVVRLHLIFLFEGCLNKSKLEYSTIKISVKCQWNQSKEYHIVSELTAFVGLKCKLNM